MTAQMQRPDEAADTKANGRGVLEAEYDALETSSEYIKASSANSGLTEEISSRTDPCRHGACTTGIGALDR